MNLLVKRDVLFRSYRSASKMADIAPPDIPGWLRGCFTSDESSWHLAEDHRGKTAHDVASGDARYLFRTRSVTENVTVIAGRGVSEVERHSPVKDTEAENCSGSGRRKKQKQPDAGSRELRLRRFRMLQIWKFATEEEISLVEAWWKKYRKWLLNRVDTSTAPDIVVLPVPVG